MARRKKRRRGWRPPPLTVPQILAWADAFHRRQGRWPNKYSGWVAGAFEEKWNRIDGALAGGYRGLPGGSSLAQLLSEHRGVRNLMSLPRFKTSRILAWADAHQRRTADWPHYASGPIPEAPGETWLAVDSALRYGQRGLPGGSSLAKLLDERRHVRNIRDLPRLTIRQILAWADAHHRRHGAWPTQDSGLVLGGRGETWKGVQTCLQKGGRGLPGGSSLAKVLARHRGVRNLGNLEPLHVPRILRWADAFFRKQGRWPMATSGVIARTRGETWMAVQSALQKGSRGLPGGSSLARLLVESRGVRSRRYLPRLTRRQILAWADAHYQRTGSWPSKMSGPIPGADGESWAAVENALRLGTRGLPGGMSIGRLLRLSGRKPHRTWPRGLALAAVRAASRTR